LGKQSWRVGLSMVNGLKIQAVLIVEKQVNQPFFSFSS
jgi:hypothetical protein